VRPAEADAGAEAARGGVACGGRGRLGVTVVDHGAPDVLAEQLASTAADQGDRRRRWPCQPGTEGVAPVVLETKASARAAGEVGSGALSRRAGGGGAHSRMGRSGAPATGVGRDNAGVGRGGAPAARVSRDDSRVGMDGDGRRIGRRPE
jgi:hypothetical protein